MVWYNNPILKAQLQSILKKSNQRIIQLAATYGKKSYTFNNYTNILEAGPLQEYIKTRKNVVQKGVSIGDIKALDIRKVFQAVESGKISRQELNQIIGKMAGVHVDASGELQTNTQEKGIQTISQIRKETKKRMINRGEDPRELSENEIDAATEQYFDFTTNFDTSYAQAIKEIGEAKMRNDEIMGKLWYEKRGFRKLSYDEMIDIKREMDKVRRNARKAALKTEEE